MKRRKVDPVRAWVNRLNRYRPGIMQDTLAALRQMYGRPTWERVVDPTSELILTMLSANSADINAEKAFDLLCRRWPQAQRERIEQGALFRPGGEARASRKAQPTGRPWLTRPSTS